MVTLANELHNRGRNVELVIVRAEGPFRSLVDSTLPVAQIQGKNTLHLQYSLWRYLSENDINVLLSTMEIPNIISVLAGRITTTPVVLRIASVNSRRNRQGRYRTIPLLKRLLYPRADSIIAISDSVGRYVVEKTGVGPQEVTTIYNPAFDPEIPIKARESVDHDWLVDSEKRVVIGVGHLKPAKDFPTLLKAISYLNQSDDVYLLLVGEGERKSRLAELATQLGIRDHVSFPGFVDNPYAYMARADVFALSSAWEGFGNVIVEAMACGTPVVSTDCPGGPSEILEGGAYGALVPTGDEIALANAIRDMLRRPMDSELLVSRAKEFSIDTIADQYEQTLLTAATQSH